MPSQYLRFLSDQDVEALLAYLRAQPAIEHPVPKTRLNFLGLLLAGAGLFPTTVQTDVPESIEAPLAGPTADYGEYLVNFSMCRDCHGSDLRGGDPEGHASCPLPPVVASWNAESLSPPSAPASIPADTADDEQMPWSVYSATFTDDELLASTNTCVHLLKRAV
jgi:mono/diheme cytochrome c family protein